MKITNVLDLGEIISEVVEDAKFERSNDEFYIVISASDLPKVEDFVDENDLNVGIIYLNNGKFKLFLT